MSSSNVGGTFGLGPCCLKPGHVVAETPKGSMVTFGGIDCYRSGSSSEKALIISTDIFGLRWDNPKVIADVIAAGGFTVLVPNTLSDAADPTKPIDFANFPAWLSRNTPEAAAAILEKVAQQLHSDGFKFIAVSGYCYGARPVYLLQLNCELVNVAVYSHPSLMKLGDGARLRSGTSLLINCAESDRSYTPELQADFEFGAKKAGVHLQVIYYPRTVHGFATRNTDSDNEKGKRDIESATINILKFLQINSL